MRNGILTLLAAALFVLPGISQVGVSAGRYSFGNITAVGPVGQYISYEGVYAPPSLHTLQWTVIGTVTSCAVQLEGTSDDPVNGPWFNLGGSQNCSVSGIVHIPDRPVIFVRANATAFSGTGSVRVIYTRGPQ